MNPVPRALGLLLFVTLAAAAGLQVFPTSPAEREARPGEFVTHVFRVEGEGGPYPVEATSSAGFPILSRLDSVVPPRFLPITVRVPGDALEGTLDVLTVRVADASAEARTRVAYRPGLRLEGPERLTFLPPAVVASFALENTGNGRDEVFLKLFKDDQVRSSRRLSLSPGETRRVEFRIPSPGSYRLEATLRRGGLVRTWRFTVSRARARGGVRQGYYLHGLGSLRARYPSGPAGVSLGLRGVLSDYMDMDFAASWDLGRLPQVALTLRGDRWRAGGRWDGILGGELAYRPDPYEFSLRFRGWSYLGLGLSYRVPSQRHHLSLDWGGTLGLSAFGDSALGPGTKGVYVLRYRPLLGDGMARLELWRMPWLGWLEVDTQPELSAGVDFKRHRLEAGVRATWRPGGSSGWQAALLWRPQETLEGWDPVLGAWVSRQQLGALLALEESGTSEATRATLQAQRDWAGGWSLSASLSRELPSPFTSAQASVSWAPDGVRARASIGAQNSAFGLLYRARAWLAWPYAESGLSLQVQTGADLWSVGGEALLYPARPEGRGEAWIETYLGRAATRLSVYRDFPAGGWGAKLGLIAPLSVELPPAVVEFFGGRKLGIVEGRLVHDGPPVDLSGVRVVAGPYQAITDSEGRFRLELPPGEYLIAVDPATLPAVFAPLNGGVPLRVEAKKRYTLELELEARAAIRGQIRARGEAPDSLALWIAIEDEAGRKTYVRADRLGRFVVGGLRPGRYTLWVLERSLPWGYRVEPERREVELAPGETARVEFWLEPKPKKILSAKPVVILSVEPEREVLPPAAEPYLEARLEGDPDALKVQEGARVLGELEPRGAGLWGGRFRLPERAGKHLLRLVAYLGGQPVTEYPFVIEVREDAPWGVVRTRPIVPRGAKGVPLAVHLFAPAKRAWLVLEGRRFALRGGPADWRGSFDAPAAPGRYPMRVFAELEDGRLVVLERSVLVR